ncbi:YkyA family protein [Oceanobacillus halotolerans]|uniref:YkyA family protein n=1 Tax=Oceanobacillus halotolerans TaxID=2663380 RepID=UPI001CF781CF|nr:YkyA family protein [Oceanobacillus halotolerans]
MSLKKLRLVVAIGLMLFLIACNSTSTQDQIYNHLEEAVSLEEVFENQQQPIAELEKQEQALYNEIIDLTMEELDQIQELSKDAISLIEEREEKIELEKDSISASKEEFSKIESLLDEIEEEDVKRQGKEMYDVMMNRYDAYDDLYEVYTESLSLEKTLYEMLQEEETEQEQLTNHITEINETYQKVLEANDQFNAYTVEYNELKEEFYRLAGIEVTYEEHQNDGSNDEVENPESTDDENDEEKTETE